VPYALSSRHWHRGACIALQQAFPNNVSLPATSGHCVSADIISRCTLYLDPSELLTWEKHPYSTIPGALQTCMYRTQMRRLETNARCPRQWQIRSLLDQGAGIFQKRGDVMKKHQGINMELGRSNPSQPHRGRRFFATVGTRQPHSVAARSLYRDQQSASNIPKRPSL
jgi:hypothetical protein